MMGWRRFPLYCRANKVGFPCSRDFPNAYRATRSRYPFTSSSLQWNGAEPYTTLHLTFFGCKGLVAATAASCWLVAVVDAEPVASYYSSKSRPTSAVYCGP
ncbi:hypothetical protein J6590_027243 [Homalodisca vitripennis]|nr:hypothetical protein J6590_027243 [Homalodisca vitripennis]